MKKIILFVALVTVTLTSHSQSLGYEDLSIIFSRDDGNGSARFVAMSGAFGALGGDVTAIAINPAGLSVFNNSITSIDFQSRNSNFLTNYYGVDTTTQQDYFKITNAGAVFTFDTQESDEWTKLALGVNYRILADFEDTFIAQGNSGFASFDSFPFDNNVTPILYDVGENQQFTNFYNGELSELSIAFSGLHNENLHIGAGLNLYDLTFSQQSILFETNSDGNGNTLDARFYQENFTTGSGFSLSAGFIYKPTNSIRLGLSYQTPRWFIEMIEDTNIADNDGFFGETDIVVSEDLQNPYENNKGNFARRQGVLYRLRTPSKLTASTAIVFGKFGLISLDYTTRNFKGISLSEDDFSQENQFFDNQLRRTSAINLGTEWRVNKFSFRGGYKYEQSPDKNAISSDNLQGYSFGLGYNFGSVKFNLAYATNNRTGLYNFYPQYNQVDAAEIDIDNTVITAGFSIKI